MKYNITFYKYIFVIINNIFISIIISILLRMLMDFFSLWNGSSFKVIEALFFDSIFALGIAWGTFVALKSSYVIIDEGKITLSKPWSRNSIQLSEINISKITHKYWYIPMHKICDSSGNSIIISWLYPIEKILAYMLSSKESHP